MNLTLYTKTKINLNNIMITSVYVGVMALS